MKPPTVIILAVVLLVCSVHQGKTQKILPCDDYFQSWCQLYNVALRSEADIRAVAFPSVQQIGFIRGTITNFSHLMNIQLFKAGVWRIFARGTIVNRITMPTTIEQLYLRDNGLTGVEIEPRARYDTLRYLRIQMNKLRNVTNFEFLTELVELNLCDNLLEQIPFEVFSSMKNLQQLLLCGNRLKTLSSPPALQLGALIQLDLGKNFLSQLPLATWNFPKLININLRDNLLATLDIDTMLRNFPSLQIFDATVNPLDCQSFHEAQRQLANRSIVHWLDRRMCPSTAPDTAVSRPGLQANSAADPDPPGTVSNPIEVRQLKERLYQQVRMIDRQRMQIEQLRANLTTLMEQFDLIAGPVPRVSTTFH